MRYMALVLISLGMCGCLNLTRTPKERSVKDAVAFLKMYNNDKAFDSIRTCTDIDALRVIGSAAASIAWPMNADENVVCDECFDMLVRAVLYRLKELDCEQANDSLDYLFRQLPADGAYSLLKGELLQKEGAEVGNGEE